MLSFKKKKHHCTSGRVKTAKKRKKRKKQECCFTCTPIKFYNFSMLINMSIVILQVPDTLHLLAVCTFSKYTTVDSVFISWKLWNTCSHGSVGGIINFMLHIQPRLLLFLLSRIDEKQKLAGFCGCVMLMSVENILDVTRPNDLLFVESLEVGIRWKLLDKKKQPLSPQLARDASLI